MVIDITNKNITIDEFFHRVELDVQQAVHEMEMDYMLCKYNYLQENGVIMEAEEKKSILTVIKNIFDAIKKGIVNAKDFIIRKIKGSKTDDKKKECSY